MDQEGRDLHHSEVVMLATYGPTVTLTILAILAFWLIRSWQKSHPNFDLSDILTGDNGKVSLSKMGQAAALVVSTWGFVVLTQQGKLSSEYFIGYMMVWTGAKIAQSSIDKRTVHPASGE